MSPDSRCRWCARPIPAKAGPGRPPDFCSRQCRRRWHLQKEQADEGAERDRIAADEGKIRERERARQERARKRERESLTGEALLSALQSEAQLDLRCIWDVSHDPPKVCGVKLRGPDAGTATPYCKKHDRLVDEANEIFKRDGREAADAFYRRHGVEP